MLWCRQAVGSENEIKDLIESNLRQRGDGNPNPMKLGRCNLSPIQRIAIAEKYRSLYEKQAKRINQTQGKIMVLEKKSL